MTAAAPTPLVLLRHGPTAWNAEGRIQGQSDQPLSAAGRDRVRQWRLPEALHGYVWVTSPLARARETAALLGHADAAVVRRLAEAGWGEWEGERLAELRERFGPAMTDLEARGLDFRPPGGESPREVQDRLKPWLAEVASAGRPTLAVAHKGVIRALYALAEGWDMRGKPPGKLNFGCAFVFELAGDGTPAVVRTDLELLP